MNPRDLNAIGVAAGDRVGVVGPSDDGEARVARGLRLVRAY
ncbi:hypothetical protein [Falsirhodobacter xinxiangensis]|nr:hypothetical protein [Rhodobacter xinxiangensis]